MANQNSVANTNVNPSQVFRVNVALSASQAANTVSSGSFLQSQTDTTGVAQLFVPPNQIWRVSDSFVSSALTTDLICDLWVGNTAQNINWDANTTSLALGTTRINPFAYMVGGGMLIAANSYLQFKALLTAANGSAAATEVVSLVITQHSL